MARCARCNESCLTEEFITHEGTKSSWCAECRNAFRKDYVAAGEDVDKKAARYDAQKAFQSRKYKRRRKELRDVLITEGCICCGTHDEHRTLGFHHRSPAGDDREIQSILATCSEAGIAAELARCDVMCKRCHNQVHSVLRGRTIYHSHEGVINYLKIQYGIIAEQTGGNCVTA